MATSRVAASGMAGGVVARVVRGVIILLVTRAITLSVLHNQDEVNPHKVGRETYKIFLILSMIADYSRVS